jgi:hypothetical protein
MSKLRFDLIFSYWIFIWFIFYQLNLIKFSPKFALIIGLIENFIMLIMMLLYKTQIETIFYFVIINTFIKVIPLYYLRNNDINWNDIYFTIILFIIFIVWLYINKKTIIGNLKLIYDSLIYNKNDTPLLSLIKKFKNNFKNYKNPEFIDN